MKWIKKVFEYFIEDLFILGGLAIIIYQTYQLNQTIATYILGGILFIYGIMLSRR